MAGTPQPAQATVEPRGNLHSGWVSPHDFYEMRTLIGKQHNGAAERMFMDPSMRTPARRMLCRGCGCIAPVAK
ncbi:MAG: hypothetical protein K2Q97_15940 [Burkholderiaceae bacterium]|nr:hypothetical protein [Burkholderiaceae bacterium]